MAEQLNDVKKSAVAAQTFSSAEIANIKNWYTKKNYSKTFIQEMQREVKTADDGAVGKNTINAVRSWQISKNLTPDGKFGNDCAKAAGLTISSKGASNNAVKPANNVSDVKNDDAKDDAEVPAGGGINAAPLFQKQTDYPTSPYVNKSDYQKMKNAMGDTPYASWDVTSSKLKGLYATARANNGGASTIKTSGCGVTSYANLKGMTPTDAAEYAMKNNYRVYGSGTSGSLYLANGGTKATDAKSALSAVANGKYLICSVHNNIWHTSVKGGHYILIYGYDGTYVYVSDPNSGSAANAKAPKSEFLKSGAFKHGYLF